MIIIIIIMITIIVIVKMLGTTNNIPHSSPSELQAKGDCLYYVHYI